MCFNAKEDAYREAERIAPKDLGHGLTGTTMTYDEILALREKHLKAARDKKEEV